MPFPQRVRLLFGSIWRQNFQFCWSAMFIPDPESRIRMFPIPYPGYWILIFSILDPWSQIWIFSFPGPGSRTHIKEFKYFNQKNGFSALRNMIQVFHPGSRSRIWILTFYFSQIPILDPRSQIQGSKRQRIPDPGSGFATLEISGLLRLRGSVGYWLSTGAAVLRTHSMDQLSEACMCQKEFSVYFIYTLSLQFLLFISYDALRICFLAHLVPI